MAISRRQNSKAHAKSIIFRKKLSFVTSFCQKSEKLFLSLQAEFTFKITTII